MISPAARRFVIVRSTEAYLYGTIFAATMVYMVGLGLSPLELVLVGTALEATILLCEVPTGIVADRRSRKVSVVIGYLVVGAAYVLMGLVPHVAAIIAASALWGLGYTFGSGAHDAWMVDESEPSEIDLLFPRLGRTAALAGVGGTLTGMALGTVALPLPIVAGGTGFLVLALVTARAVPETSFHPRTAAPCTSAASPPDPSPASNRNPFAAMAATARDGIRAVRGSSVLVALIVVTIVMGAYSEGFDRLRDAQLIRTIGVPGPLDPIVWIGAMGIAGSLLGAAANGLLERTIARIRRPGIPLAAATLALGAVILTLARTRSFATAVAAVVIAGGVRAAAGPLQAAWINRHVRSEVRATVLSFYGQADSVGQVTFGPVAGAIGATAGIPVALAVSAAVLVPAAWLYLGTAVGSRTLREEAD